MLRINADEFTLAYLTPTQFVLNPAVVKGVPDVFNNAMSPPSVCVNTKAPLLLILHETYGTAAALTAATKSLAAVPARVAV